MRAPDAEEELASELMIFRFRNEYGELADRIMSVTGRRSIGWHYCMDYAFALEHFRPENDHRILDVGCGPRGNPLHDYIEREYGSEIFGIDRHSRDGRWFRAGLRDFGRFLGKDPALRQRPDWIGDLLEFTEAGWDFILAISSLEHNPPGMTETYWHHAQSLLAPEGRMVCTFSISPDGISRWNRATKAMDLSLDDAQRYWNCTFHGNMADLIRTYDSHYLKMLFAARFGTSWAHEPPYLAAGTVKYGSSRTTG
jgi:SAM-dependent methyltransferase